MKRPKIWNSVPEDIKDLTLHFQNLQNSLKHGTDLNINATSANTRVTHITILESANKTSNVAKLSYFHVSIVGFWCVHTH